MVPYHPLLIEKGSSNNNLLCHKSDIVPTVNDLALPPMAFLIMIKSMGIKHSSMNMKNKKQMSDVFMFGYSFTIIDTCQIFDVIINMTF